MQIAFRHLSRLSVSFVTLCRSFGRGAIDQRRHAARQSPPAAVHLLVRSDPHGQPPMRCAGSPAAPQPAWSAATRCQRPAPALRAGMQATRSVRVLRQREGSAERLAIVGRMADVCAELDRLVARERLC